MKATPRRLHPVRKRPDVLEEERAAEEESRELLWLCSAQTLPNAGSDAPRWLLPTGVIVTTGYAARPWRRVRDELMRNLEGDPGRDRLRGLRPPELRINWNPGSEAFDVFALGGSYRGRYGGKEPYTFAWTIKNPHRRTLASTISNVTLDDVDRGYDLMITCTVTDASGDAASASTVIPGKRSAREKKTARGPNQRG